MKQIRQMEISYERFKNIKKPAAENKEIYSLYKHKLKLIEHFANKFAKEFNLDTYNVCDLLIHEASERFCVAPPQNPCSIFGYSYSMPQYRDLSKPAEEFFEKHAEFPAYLEKMIKTRWAAYLFIQLIAEDYVSKLPNNLDDGDGEKIKQLKIICSSLKLSEDSLCDYSEDSSSGYSEDSSSDYSEDGTKLYYKQDYKSRIAAALAIKLIEAKIIESKIIILGACKVIEVSNCWYLADTNDDKIVIQDKILDTAILKDLRMLGYNFEDWLHRELHILSKKPPANIQINYALAALIKFNRSKDYIELDKIKLEDLDLNLNLKEELFLLSDQADFMKRYLSEEEIKSMPINYIKKWIDFVYLMEGPETPDKADSILKCIISDEDDSILDAYIRSSDDSSKNLVDNYEDEMSEDDLRYLASLHERGELVYSDDSLKNLVDKYGNNLLHLAFLHKRLDLLPKLISYGVDVNKPNDALRTPLYLALKTKNEYAVKILTKSGANINYKDTNGDTLFKAILFINDICFYDAEIVRLLLLYGLDRNIEHASSGRTLLEYIIIYDDVISLELMIGDNTDIDINKPNNKDTTLLESIVRSNSIKTLTFLLDKGVNINQEDQYFQRALNLAISHKKANIISLLSSKGYYKLEDEYAETLLYSNNEKENNEIISLLRAIEPSSEYLWPYEEYWKSSMLENPNTLCFDIVYDKINVLNKDYQKNSLLKQKQFFMYDVNSMCNFLTNGVNPLYSYEKLSFIDFCEQKKSFVQQEIEKVNNVEQVIAI